MFIRGELYMKKRLLLLPISTLLLFGCSRNATPTYTVRWLNYDGSELEVDLKVKKNSMPQYDGDTPVRAQDAQYTYTFTGWTPALDKVTRDIDYTATYSHQVRSYTITWVVEGNTVKTETLEYGATPVFGANPTKDSTQEHTYTFTGWSPEVTTVTGDATYTAQFREDVRQYTVSWVVEGNTVREDSVGYGSCPVWGSSDPSKDSTAQYSYTFDGWDRDLSIPITGDVTIHGSYTAHIRSYNVKFLDNDGNILSNQTLEYGETPSCDYEFTVKSDYYYNYSFSHWDHEIEYVTGDATYVAVYTQCPCNFIDNGNGTMYVSGLRNSEYQGEVVIPETWCGSTVTGIGSGAFRNARGITRVVVPDTITGIGSETFYNCGLTSIDLSKTQLTTLKSTTFMNCHKLSEVQLPDTLQTIESECFRLCTTLHHMVFPDSMRTFGDYAFEECIQLYSIQFGPSYENSFMGNSVFERCGSLTEVVYTGSSIAGITGYSVQPLKSVVGTQNKGQFKAYEGQEGDVSIMTYKAIDSNEEVIVGQYGADGTSLHLDGTRKIKNFAFYENGSIVDLSIAVNSSDAEIGQYAFGYCRVLKTVSFSSTVDFDIPSYCFRDCVELESVDFGEARVKRIGYDSVSHNHVIASRIINNNDTLIYRSKSNHGYAKVINAFTN